MDQNEMHRHQFETTIIPPTCKEVGYTLHRCECGYEYKDNFQPIGNHSFEIVEEIAPTCTEQGTRTLQCSTCSETRRDIHPALGHDWDDWNVLQFATCTEDGKRVRHCKRCGTTEEEILKATGHNVPSKKKSQTHKGMSEGFCINCGETVLIPSKLSKLKKYKKTFVTAITSILLLVGIIIGTNKFLLPPFHYYRAQKLIQNEKYLKAYEHLIKCRNYKDSKELLMNFEFKYDKLNVVDTFYDEDGNKETARASKTYKYDEYGNITSYCEPAPYDSSGKEITNGTYKYEYHSDGTVKSQTLYEDGVLVSKREYNEYGDKTLFVSYDDHKEISYKQEYSYEYYDIGKIYKETSRTNGAIDCITTYDEFGNLLSTINYEDGKVSSKTVCSLEYDKYDHVVSKIVYENNDEAYNYEYEYKYDKKGKMLSSIEYKDGKKEKHYKYDKYENITSIIVYDSDGEESIEYKHKYDKHGCLQQVTFSVNGNKSIEYKYNEYGLVTYRAHYTTNGKLSSKYECEYSGLNVFYKPKN